MTSLTLCPSELFVRSVLLHPLYERYEVTGGRDWGGEGGDWRKGFSVVTAEDADGEAAPGDKQGLFGLAPFRLTSTPSKVVQTKIRSKERGALSCCVILSME